MTDKWIFEDLLNGDVELIIFDATDDDATTEGFTAASSLYPGWECIDQGMYGDFGDYYVFRAPGKVA
jgi:hypothetical protein